MYTYFVLLEKSDFKAKLRINSAIEKNSSRIINTFKPDITLTNISVTFFPTIFNYLF